MRNDLQENNDVTKPDITKDDSKDQFDHIDILAGVGMVFVLTVFVLFKLGIL